MRFSVTLSAMNKPQITKAVVFAYLAHQATPIERQQIEAWLKTTEGIEAYFTYLDEWERLFPQFQANLEEARDKFRKFVAKANENDIPEEISVTLRQLPGKQQPGWLHKSYRLILAASVVLLAGMWFAKDLWYYQTWTSRNQETRTIRLQDGSEVELGANSSLKHPRFGFGRGTRHVWLNGDAEFKVAHLANAVRFEVHTPDQTVIEVLGTEFVVNSRPKATKVMLRTGSIRLTNPIAGRPLIMEPGDLVTITTEKKVQKKQLGPQPARTNWKNQQFEFQDTPLKEVARQLYDTYGVKVEMAGPKILNRTISGTFQAETAEDLLEAITLMMKLEAEETPEGYLLRQPAE